MKTIAITTSLLVVLGFGVRQNKRGVPKTRTVSAATIARLSPGKTYEIDLTHSGTIYLFDDEGTDFSRVTIRTAAGIQTFGDLLRTSNTSLKGGLLVGTPADMRTHLPASKPVKTNYKCSALFCTCNGIVDCTKLIFSGHCGGVWCGKGTGTCICTALP